MAAPTAGAGGARRGVEDRHLQAGADGANGKRRTAESRPYGGRGIVAANGRRCGWCGRGIVVAIGRRYGRVHTCHFERSEKSVSPVPYCLLPDAYPLIPDP